ncbi:MAG: hypothetical protein ACTHKF_05250 [Candidatus Nitrosocosmicus sp.]
MDSRKITIFCVCISLSFLLLVATPILNINSIKMMAFASSSSE